MSFSLLPKNYLKLCKPSVVKFVSVCFRTTPNIAIKQTWDFFVVFWRSHNLLFINTTTGLIKRPIEYFPIENDTCKRNITT